MYLNKKKMNKNACHPLLYQIQYNGAGHHTLIYNSKRCEKRSDG